MNNYRTNGAIDWERLFSTEKYQAHHLDPVNLFANNTDGSPSAFRLMFENHPDPDELIQWFNSPENGILVPSKRIVDGVEVVIHSNHPNYNTQIRDWLAEEWNLLFRVPSLTKGEISEGLFALLRQKQSDLSNKIIENALLDNVKIDEIQIR